MPLTTAYNGSSVRPTGVEYPGTQVLCSPGVELELRVPPVSFHLLYALFFRLADETKVAQTLVHDTDQAGAEGRRLYTVADSQSSARRAVLSRRDRFALQVQVMQSADARESPAE